uniref:Uncharacterized protein n=1 Tax=Strigamia maritima TaxID=126957 RepID=T1JLA1_STRMM
MEIRLFVLAVYVFAACLADTINSPNAPVITSAITKVARANDVKVTKKTPKPDSSTSLEPTTPSQPPPPPTTTTTIPITDVKSDNTSNTSPENIWTALETFLATPSNIESSATSVPSTFIKLLQSLDDVTTKTEPKPENHDRFARQIDEDEDFEDDPEEPEDSTPLTPSLEDALARLANARDDHVISFESDTHPTPPTPPPTAPAWARVPLYYQGAGLQLSREPSPPALVNPSLTSVPSNTLDLSALLAMMLRSYPSSPSPLIPNLLFPSMSIVNRTFNALPQPPQTPDRSNSVNSLFGKSYNPSKMSPDVKMDDKDGSSKELDPAESTQDKVSAKKPDDNDYEYEYVYYYYDEDDPNNKTMVVKPASAVKPKNDQKLGLTAVPALLPRQPVGPSAAEGRSVDGGSGDNALREQMDKAPLTPFFTTPPTAARQPFVQGPQAPVMFLGIQKETYQGPRVPARTHPAKEPDDLYAFSRAFEDQTSLPVLPFTYKPELEGVENEGRVFEPNSTDDEVIAPVIKLTTTKTPKRTTTEKATTTVGRGRRPGGRKRTTTQATISTTRGRKVNPRKNRPKGKETTEKMDDEDEDVTTEKPARGGRKGGRPTRTRTTAKPKGGRRKTTLSPRSVKSNNGKTTVAVTTADAITTHAPVGITKRLSNLFPRRKTLRPLSSTTAAPAEEEGGNEEEEIVSSTEKVTTTTGRKVRTSTIASTTTVSELSEEGVEAEIEPEEVIAVTSAAPKSPIHRLRPLRPLRIKTTTPEPENSLNANCLNHFFVFGFVLLKY